VTPEELDDSRRHAARMSTQELGALYVRGPSGLPAEAWAIIEEEVQRRERAVRLAHLSSTDALRLSAGTVPAAGGANWVLRGALLLGFLGVLGVGYYAFLKLPKPLPTCDSTAAESAVRGAIENSVLSRLVNNRLLRLHNQSQVSYNERRMTRICKGTAILNSGDVAIRYRLYKLSATDASFLVEVTYR
jgi:hypothetical protein